MIFLLKPNSCLLRAGAVAGGGGKTLQKKDGRLKRKVNFLGTVTAGVREYHCLQVSSTSGKQHGGSWVEVTG